MLAAKAGSAIGSAPDLRPAGFPPPFRPKLAPGEPAGTAVAGTWLEDPASCRPPGHRRTPPTPRPTPPRRTPLGLPHRPGPAGPADRGPANRGAGRRGAQPIGARAAGGRGGAASGARAPPPARDPGAGARGPRPGEGRALSSLTAACSSPELVPAPAPAAARAADARCPDHGGVGRTFGCGLVPGPSGTVKQNETKSSKGK